ncbi:chemotaxis protein CheW [Agaribacter flavus]|uniref:Chemotaxis protein CheW n=1 Tax=Agaribacter flavus TaxID=1902781 RepID=A0ABV7FJC3_9ALTE
MPESKESDLLSSYFSALTSIQSTESETDKEALSRAEKLLKQASVSADLSDKELDSKDIGTSAETMGIQLVSAPELSLEKRLPSTFQALFFEVAGIKLAIPLVELGGIHEMKKLTPLPGKADWVLGVLIKGSEKLNCIDTAKWVMPERYTQQLADSLQYSYAVQLGKTPWVLACEALKDTEELSITDIKWRDQTGSRPWLAGMVKEKMCALIDAEKLVWLLTQKS